MTIDIADIRLGAGIAGFWVQDQPAVQTGAQRDGFFYEGEPVSPGFREIKEPSQAYCVMLRLADGATLLGDCLTVVDAGYAGRPAPLRHEDREAVEKVLRGHLEGKRFCSFLEAAKSLDTLELPGDTARPVAYGVSQALLAAAAHATGISMAEVVAREFDGTIPAAWPGFAAVCEGDWYANVDKAIVRRVAMFPHCGIQKKEDVERLPEYMSWMLSRIAKRGVPGYKPDLHIDLSLIHI